MNFKKILESSPAFIIPAVINLFTLLVFTRNLSLVEYGMLSLALITIEFSQGLIFQWIKLAMVRFYDSQKKMESITVALQLNIGICLVLILFYAILFNSYFNYVDKAYVLFIILGVIGRSFCNFFLDFIRMTNVNFRKYTYVSLTSNIFYFVPALVYVSFNKSPQINTILGIQTVGVTIYMFCVLLSKYHILVSAFKNFKKKAEYMEFINYGMPLIFVFLAASAFVRIDRFIIEQNLGLAQLGVYSAAYSLSNLAISSFFSIITLPTYPEIIRKLNNGKEVEAQKIYRNNGNLILGIGVPIVIACFYFNEVLTDLFFADKGNKIALIFPYVIVGTFLLNLKTHYFDQIFQFVKKTKLLMYLGLTIGICHFFLSYYLSIMFGSKGVAFSVSILNFCAILFIYKYSRKIFKITFSRTIIRFLFITIISCLGSLLFNYFN